MRRMLTETEVEKLDSIQPSEIEKLGKITNADIESVKATQSPIGATAGQVLTADGKGKAVYKAPASGGTNIIYKKIIFRTEIKQDTKKGTFAEMEVPDAKHIVSLHFTNAYLYVGGIEPAIPYAEVQLISIPFETGSTITILIP